MLQWAVIFLFLAIAFAVFGFGGLAQESAFIARILAVIWIVLAILSFMIHWRKRRA